MHYHYILHANIEQTWRHHTFELTVGSKLYAIVGQEEVVAKVAIYDATDTEIMQTTGEIIYKAASLLRGSSQQN